MSIIEIEALVKDDTDLIQKVVLFDDGGLFEAYQDGE